MELTEWQKLIAAQALKKLFAGKHFDITALDSIAVTMGVNGGGRLRDELRTLHCMDYSDMHPAIREQLPQKVCEYLQQSIDMAYIEQMISDFEKPVAKIEGPSRLAKLLSFSKATSHS
jgi:hypothetical protein